MARSSEARAPPAGPAGTRKPAVRREQGAGRAPKAGRGPGTSDAKAASEAGVRPPTPPPPEPRLARGAPSRPGRARVRSTRAPPAQSRRPSSGHAFARSTHAKHPGCVLSLVIPPHSPTAPTDWGGFPGLAPGGEAPSVLDLLPLGPGFGRPESQKTGQAPSLEEPGATLGCPELSCPELRQDFPPGLTLNQEPRGKVA